MEYFLGFGIAISVALFASLIGFDKERSFYAVVLMVIASYYILFAAMAASRQALAVEALPTALFVLVAVIGFKRNAWLLVAGLAAHSVFDFTHEWIITNAGVPSWWPGFCLAYDLTAALYLAFLLKSRDAKNAALYLPPDRR